MRLRSKRRRLLTMCEQQFSRVTSIQRLVWPAGCFSKIVGPDKHNLPWQLAQNTLILAFSLREKELPLPLGEGRVRGLADRADAANTAPNQFSQPPPANSFAAAR